MFRLNKQNNNLDLKMEHILKTKKLLLQNDKTFFFISNFFKTSNSQKRKQIITPAIFTTLAKKLLTKTIILLNKTTSFDLKQSIVFFIQQLLKNEKYSIIGIKILFSGK